MKKQIADEARKLGVGLAATGSMTLKDNYLPLPELLSKIDSFVKSTGGNLTNYKFFSGYDEYEQSSSPPIIEFFREKTEEEVSAEIKKAKERDKKLKKEQVIWKKKHDEQLLTQLLNNKHNVEIAKKILEEGL